MGLAGGPPQPKPFKVIFSILRLSRKDPAERAFIRLLNSVDKDLDQSEAVKQPMIFPLFGRGRALGALVGEGIESENIMRACALLVGPCACEIKHQNPGVDMLFTADWPAAVGMESDLIEEVGLPTPAGTTPATQPGANAPSQLDDMHALRAVTRPAPAPEPAAGLDPIYLNTAAALALALGLAVVGGLWARRRAKRIGQ